MCWPHTWSGSRPRLPPVEVVVAGQEGVPAQGYADAGATWLVYSPHPVGTGGEATITDTIRNGP